MSGFNTVTQGITVQNNTFDLDPFHVSSSREADGTWTSVSATQCIAMNGATGTKFIGNTIKNTSRVCDAMNGLHIKSRNYVHADFSGGGAGDQAGNAGVRDIPASYPEFIIVSYDADPTSGTFGAMTSTEVQEASASIPTTGSYVISHFVRNETPSIDGNSMILLGWVRLTTGTGHVSNTDWGLCYASTVSPAN